MNATMLRGAMVGALFGLSGGCAVEPALVESTPADAPRAAAQAEEEEIPYKTVKLLIEHNGTDEDTGFQFFADGEPWKKLQVRNPRGAVVLTVTPQGKLKDLGLTEMFFETNEPPNSEVPIPEVLSNLPAGMYEFEGVTIDGIELDGEAMLSHRIPAPPVVTAPTGSNVGHDQDQLISWKPVTTAIHGGRTATVTHYQVIVNKVDQVPGPRFGAETLSVHVPASITKMKIPAEFLLPSTNYEWEVMAIEANGNQTFSTGFFTTGS